MKKLILLTAFAISYGISSGQVSFGLQAGANFGMGKYKYDDAFFTGTTSHSQKSKAKVGFLGGFVAEIPIGSSLAFRPELNFIQEGAKVTANATDIFGVYTEEQKVTLNYIQLPLNVIYKVPAGPGSAFFGLGPALEFGLSGKNKYKSTSTGSSDFSKTYKVKFDGKKSDDINNGSGDDQDHLKRFNVGLNVLAGYKLGMGAFIKLGYTYGFLELDPDKKNAAAGDRSSYKSSGFNVCLGYMFGGMKKKK